MSDPAPAAGNGRFQLFALAHVAFFHQFKKILHGDLVLLVAGSGPVFDSVGRREKLENKAEMKRPTVEAGLRVLRGRERVLAVGSERSPGLPEELDADG